MNAKSINALNMAQTAISIVWSAVMLSLLLAIPYLLYTRNDAPIKVLGHRIGNYNVVKPGDHADVIIWLDRDMNRSCDSSIKLTLRAPDNKWIAGSVFSLDASEAAVRHAHKMSPGVFKFSLDIPKDVEPGEATVVGDVSFNCSDNPLHSLWPATLSDKFYIFIE